MALGNGLRAARQGVAAKAAAAEAGVAKASEQVRARGRSVDETGYQDCVLNGVLVLHSVFKGVLVLYSVFKGVLVLYSVFKRVLIIFASGVF